jgi:hypothetical protein
MIPSKPELKALEYRARAQQATDAARACGLDRAREQNEAAALRWGQLAEAEETRARSHRDRVAMARPAGSSSETGISVIDVAP